MLARELRIKRARYGIIGTSPALLRALVQVEKVADATASVLLLGESGTGKELFARALHLASPRRDRPFVKVNCAAIPESLFESELFGHERGAFTGAHQGRPGVFERAHRGTVFLDELGELPLPVQAALLRVLEQREVRRVGGRDVKPVDVRVVAATNRDLAAEVEAGRFRRDLYYRLAVVELQLPPLRSRLEDLPLLIPHLLATAGFDHPVKDVSDEVAEAFEAWRWPGNVRELRNVLLRAIPFSAGSTLTLDALPEALQEATPATPIATEGEDGAGLPLPGPDEQFHEAKDRILEAFERHYLETLMERAGGNLSRAARLAGVDRKTVSRLLKRHDIR